ncbi:MAG: signal peptidase II [Bacilli bacterium]
MKKELGIISLIILVDQIVKIYIYNTMELGESIIVINNFFNITFHLNNGAAWGIFAGNQVFLVVITILVVCAIIYYLTKNPKLDLFTKLGLTLYLAGAIGNLIDRIRLGAVIDFFDVIVPIIKYDFPIFNIADMSLVFGFVFILISLIKDKKYE